MAADLTKPYSFITEEAKAAALAGRMPGGVVSQMLRVLDLVRDVTAGSATLFAMSINEDILRNSAGPESQISRTGLFALESLAQAANEMVDQKLEELFARINCEAEGAGERS